MNRINHTILAALATASLCSTGFAGPLPDRGDTGARDQNTGARDTSTLARDPNKFPAEVSKMLSELGFSEAGLDLSKPLFHDGKGDALQTAGKPDLSDGARDQSKPLFDSNSLQTAEKPDLSDGARDQSKPLFDTDLTLNESKPNDDAGTGARNPADINHDGVVNIDDLMIVINNWSDSAKGSKADIAPAGGDGKVDFYDLALVLKYWGM